MSKFLFSQLCKFFQTLLYVLFSCPPKVCLVDLFCNHNSIERAASLESFVFFLFASTVLSKKSCRTSRYFTPILPLASLPKYAESKHQISFLNPAKAFILLNLLVARVNFVCEVFECKTCLTFETGRLLAFTKYRTDP